MSVPAVVSATDLSEVVENTYSHDQISRMLYSGAISDKKLYLRGKRVIKPFKAEGKKVVIIDDSILAKPDVRSMAWSAIILTTASMAM